jgi:hypothetical protein
MKSTIYMRDTVNASSCYCEEPRLRNSPLQWTQLSPMMLRYSSRGRMENTKIQDSVNQLLVDCVKHCIL